MNSKGLMAVFTNLCRPKASTPSTSASLTILEKTGIDL